MEELQHAELGMWPRDSLYALVPSLAAVDKAMATNAANGRAAVKALRELLASTAKDGFVVISHGRQQRQIPAKWFAELVFQTRNTELANVRNLERFKSKGIDTVKIIGGNADQPCAAYTGKVFSLSGRHKKYPALATLLQTGALSHIACKAMFVAFIEGLS